MTYQIDCPIRESCDCITESSDFDWKDLSWVDPGNDTDRSIEQRENEVHGNHCTELVGIVLVEMLTHSGVCDESACHADCRDHQWLDSADFVD